MADARQIVDELVKLFGASEDDLLRLIRHDREYAVSVIPHLRERADVAERGLDTLTAAVAAMAIKYDARRAGKNPIQWVEEVCRRLDALREAAAQDGREKVQTKVLARALAELQEKHDALQEEHARLYNEARGALGGWWVPVEVPDDGVLPVPRLELAFAQIDGWSVYEVVYRLVYREIGGVLVGHPLSRCRKSGVPPRPPPEADDLPWRFVPEASHDAGHLALPIYIIRPDMPPREQQPTDEQRALGIEHRRESGEWA